VKAEDAKKLVSRGEERRGVGQGEVDGAACCSGHVHIHRLAVVVGRAHSERNDTPLIVLSDNVGPRHPFPEHSGSFRTIFSAAADFACGPCNCFFFHASSLLSALLRNALRTSFNDPTVVHRDCSVHWKVYRGIATLGRPPHLSSSQRV